MLHVNFLDDYRLLVKSGTITATLEELGTVEVLDENQQKTLLKEAIRNALIILLGVMGLYGYESYMLNQYNITLNQLSVQLNEVMAKNERAKQAVEQVRQLKKEQEKVQNQIQAIEDLKKGRQRPFEVLEVLHRVMPSTAWLQEVDFNEERVILRGYSTSESAITELIDLLSRQAVFVRVDLLRSNVESIQGRDNVRRFEIECKIEKKL